MNSLNKVLTFDLETSPMIAYSWGPKWETSLIEVIEQSRILSFSAKWLNGKQVTRGWPDYKGYRKGVLDDRAIVADIWDLLNSADIVVGQNSKSFDIKTVNARFSYHGLKPPSPYKSLDTKVEAKKYLRLPSNKLDDIGDYFNIGRKIEHEGFPLWKKCIAGDKSAWKRMLRYNKNDVILTEKVYLKLLPWMQSHPNAGMFKNELCCPKCGSKNIQARGFSINNSTKYRRGQCQSCGGWLRFPGNLSILKPLQSV